MNTNFVASHVLSDEDVGVRDDTRANDEESRLDLLLVEVLEQIGGVV